MAEKQKQTIEQIRAELQRFKRAEAAILPGVEGFWQIVVIGSIDFRQHTPLWYKLIGAINEDEQKQADKNFAFAVAPLPLFRFKCDAFTVSCMPDRWEITSSDRNEQRRLVDVTCLVFKKLWEISITAFGINTQLVLSTKSRDVQKVLAEKLKAMEMGLPSFSGDTESQVVFKSSTKEGSSHVTFSGVSGKPSEVSVFYNCEYLIGKTTDYYDVGEMIRPNADPAWKQAEECGARIVDRINHATEINNGH